MSWPSRFKALTAAALPLAIGLGLSVVMADGGANHQTKQTPPIQLGTSGGNVNDASKAFCCSGTLGALVERGGIRYILSNNHVLARSNQAAPGEDVSQPGLIDVGCNAANANIVADFSQAPALGTQNVDAAIAEVRGGAVSSTGAIIDVGVPSSNPAAPAVNLQVAKSGRTTGLTCGGITSINTDVQVQYQAGCGKGKKFRITYQDQVVVTGSTFSAGGDSGSLIVSAGTAQPVALLYAGSSTTTIGNPVGDVIAAFPGLSFVGGGNHAVSCPSGGGGSGGGKGGGGRPNAGQQPATPEQARNAKAQYARSLMQDDAVLGVGVGEEDGEPVVVIYVEQGREHRPLPQMLAGVRTRIIRTDEIRAFGWNERAGGGCKAR
ncbi:MAG: hypothetical protein ACRD5G_11900 [Candidatus Acidiferrales bacterium]